MRVALLCLGILFIAPRGVFAFDGDRKGVILGYGLGVGSISVHGLNSFNPPPGTINARDREDHTILVLDLLAGYSPTESVGIFVLTKLSTASMVADKPTGAVSFIGLGGRVYSRERTPAFFFDSGFGHVQWSDHGSTVRNGTGISTGLGVEFPRHFNGKLDVLVGRTPSPDRYTYSFIFSVEVLHY